jgi:hypothetical protein
LLRKGGGGRRRRRRGGGGGGGRERGDHVGNIKVKYVKDKVGVFPSLLERGERRWITWRRSLT